MIRPFRLFGDLYEQGKLDLTEAFIDGTHAGEKWRRLAVALLQRLTGDRAYDSSAATGDAGTSRTSS